jgi:predicted NUDIX family NTP pyrophosphohydrolase
MAMRSAGILLYRFVDDELQVLLAHPGGPFWKKRDFGAWTIPKGELDNDEDDATCAHREFLEETGFDPGYALTPLGEIKQKGGKRVVAFAVENDFDVASLRSNTFDLEWPPRSGHRQSFPEIDAVAWLTIPQAREKILPAQVDFLTGLEVHLKRR